MQFTQGFLLVLSILILVYIAGYSYIHRKTPGSLSFFYLVIFTIIWSIGSYFELIAKDVETMLIWRNIQQIGVFSVPILTLYFTVDYTSHPYLKKYLNIIALIPISAVLLIFSDGLHHIMRSGYFLEDSLVFGKTLVVNSTGVGMLFVGFNFSLPLVSILFLIDFRRKIAQKYKKQVTWITLSMFLTFLVAWLKMAVLTDLGIHVSISVLYIPSALIIFYSFFKFDFISLTPLARVKLFEVVKQGILVLNKDGVVIDNNEYIVKLLSKYYNFNQQLLGLKLSDIFNLSIANNEDDKEILLNENGIYLSLNNYPLTHKNNDLIGSVIIITNITEKKQYELELKERADKDSLTNLYNRNSFQREYDNLLIKLFENNQSLSILMIDFDYFKTINDTYGHLNGDKVLKHFADTTKTLLGDDAVIGRLGGEEFAVILPYVNKFDAYKTAELIRTTIKNSTVDLGNNNTTNYTLSIGVADNDNSLKKFDVIRNEADIALYQAKDQSRDVCIIYKNEK